MDIVDQIEAVLKRKTLSSKREQARAALAAMLEAVGEPVAWYREGPRTGLRVLFDTDPTRSGPATPLYSLAALEQD